MDPWLESATEWPGFHDILVIVTVQVLQPQLKERGYYANPGERVWLSEAERRVAPDVALIRRQAPQTLSGTAVLELDEPIRVERTAAEIHEGFVEIVDSAGGQVVTAIEFLSPTNKLDHEGKRLYRQKQQELQDADVHLVEIDLIRRGPHVLDIPQEVVERHRPWDYLINIARRRSREYAFHPLRLRDRLPRFRIPLKTGDEDAVLDLQEVFRRSYESGPYPERLNYAAPPPEPALCEADLEWAEKLLRESGLPL